MRLRGGLHRAVELALLPVLLTCLPSMTVGGTDLSGGIAGLDTDSLPRGPLKWHFFPLHVVPGQVKVSCGKGFVVEWFVQIGDYVTEGDPICETCPHAGTSTTCTAPASGQVVAEQPLGPDDDILSHVPDGVLAVIQPSGGKQRALRASPDAAGSCHPVKCDVGVTFGQFLVERGDYVHRGDVVALALTAEGTMDHCRAPVDGRLAALTQHIRRGEDMSSLKPPQTVGCVLGSAAQSAGRAGGKVSVGHRTCQAEGAGPKHGGGAQLGASSGGQAGKEEPEAEQKSHGALTSKLESRQDPDEDGKSPARTSHTAESDASHLRAASNPGEKSAEWPPAEQKSGGGAFAQPLGGVGHSTVFSQPVLGLVWAAAALVAGAVLSLGGFLLCGKSQTRSLYMLMQDSREDLSKGLRIDFRDASGGEQSFCFENQPLGITLSKQYPFRVDRFEFNSQAKEKRVQQGWTLARIANQEITSKHSLPDVEQLLQDHVKILAFWPLRVDFDTGKGVQAFYFVKQPLGIEFAREYPFCVALFKPDSFAQTCGVQKGWKVVRVAEYIVNAKTSFKELNDCFASGLCHLPQVPKGLRMDFSDPDTEKEHVFYFQRRPLGLVLTQMLKPVRVDGFHFNSYAKERGVRPKWVITRIGDQSIRSNLDAEKVEKQIMEESATLAVWPLRMDFDTGKGVIRTFYFENQPLGMEIMNKVPIRVDTFADDSYAKYCGVELGWAITRVGDVEVTHESKFDHIIELLVKGVTELPLYVESQQLPKPASTVRRGLRSSFCC